MTQRIWNLPWWGAILLTILVSSGTAIALSIFIELRAWSHGLAWDQTVRLVTSEPLNLAGAQVVGTLVALSLGVRAWATEMPLPQLLGFRWVSSRKIGIACIGGLALQFPLAELSNALHLWIPESPEQQLARMRLVTPHTWKEAWILVVALSAIAPLTEEIFFRGFLLRGLQQRYPSRWTIGFTALLFGLIHMDPVAIVYACIAGVIFGLIAMRTESVIPSLAMHAAINSMPLLLPERLIPIPGFNTMGTAVEHIPLALVLGSSMIGIIAIVGTIHGENHT